MIEQKGIVSMKKSKFGLAIAVAGALSAGTASAFWNKNGNGSVETRSFDLSGFNEVAVDGDAALVIKIGAPSVTIAVDSNLFELVDVGVTDGRLEVKTSWRMKPTSRPQVVVTLPSVKNISLNGNVETQVTLGANDKSLALETNGFSNVHVTNAQLDNLVIEANGGSTVDVKGRVHGLDLEIAGNFRGEFQELDVEEAKVEGAGSTTLLFGMVASISGNLSGLNSVTYKVPPKQSTLKTN
jgi:hypothetical protein